MWPTELGSSGGQACTTLSSPCQLDAALSRYTGWSVVYARSVLATGNYMSSCSVQLHSPCAAQPGVTCSAGIPSPTMATPSSAPFAPAPDLKHRVLPTLN